MTSLNQNYDLFLELPILNPPDEEFLDKKEDIRFVEISLNEDDENKNCEIIDMT